MKDHKVTTPHWWLDDVAEHDYMAALEYLSLGCDEDAAVKLASRMRKAPVTTRRPNDILRRARLTALPMTDAGVHRDLMKLLEENGRLSPVLLAITGAGLEIADGYHRVSLMYNINPFMYMPLKIG